MWKLEAPSRTELDTYLFNVGPLVKKKLSKYPSYDAILSMTDPNDASHSILTNLLIGDPYTLERLVPLVMTNFIPSYSQTELERYKDRLKGKRKLSAADQALRDDYGMEFMILKDIFNYEEFIAGNQTLSYWITETKGANTCTYCNRQYTPTISKIGKTTKGKAHFTYITRPALDHWFSHEMYPLLGLSFYNLIPSCNVCNSGAKGCKLFNLRDYIHPHLPQPDNPNFKFRATGGGGHWILDIDHSVPSNVHNTLDAFHLKEIYAFHANLEVRDIMDFKGMASSNYLKDLYEIVLSDVVAMKSTRDAYQMLFGTMKDPKDFLQRPFSKLKYDLLMQLGVI